MPKLVIVVDEPSARYESEVFSVLTKKNIPDKNTPEKKPKKKRLAIVVRPLSDASKGYAIPKRVQGWQASLSHKSKTPSKTDSCLLKLEVRHFYCMI